MGAFYVILASALFSSKAVLVKLAYAHPVSPLTLMALRMAMSLPFYLAMLVWGLRRYRARAAAEKAGDRGAGAALRPAPGLHRFRTWMQIALVGLLGYHLASYLDFEGLRFISAGLERMVLYTYPSLVVLFGFLFFRRALAPGTGMALLLCYGGIAVAFQGEALTLPAAGGILHAALGMGLVFLSAIAFALSLLFGENLNRALGPPLLTALSMIFATVFIFFHLSFQSLAPLFSQPLPLYGLALGLALFCTVLPSLLFNTGVSRIGAGKAAILGSIGPCSTLFLEWGLLGRKPGLLAFLGLMLVVAGGLILSRSKRK